MSNAMKWKEDRTLVMIAVCPTETAAEAATSARRGVMSSEKRLGVSSRRNRQLSDSLYRTAAKNISRKDIPVVVRLAASAFNVRRPASMSTSFFYT
jgi:hypothetical protein